MGSIIQKTIITLMIFFIPPVVILSINWQWQPNALNNLSYYFYLVTQTAGRYWGIVTVVVMVILFCFCMGIKSKINMIKFIVVLGFAILFGQAIKSVVKNYTSESRPFILWIESEFNISDEYFYSLPREGREQLIESHIKNLPTIPDWLYRHWRSETGYSFPSGHTIFATTWAFLALLFIRRRQYYFIVELIIIWAILVEISRLSLGMHSVYDLILGSVFSLFVSSLTYFLAKKWQFIDES